MNRLLPTLLAALALLCAPRAGACTAAIVGAHRSATGKTLLWKHRDTSATRNFVARANSGEFAFTALFNAGDSLLSEAWAGINEEGFAIINTQSYNLAPDTAALADREGVVMALALGKCRSVDDFGNLLDTLARPMGVQANFGAIDALGNAAWFETSDHGYRRFDVSPDSIAIRTNFSGSGTCGRGLGLERHAAASALILPRGKISPEFLTDTVSCSFYPDRGRLTYTDRGQYIPRRSTSASMVIETDGTLHVKPGYPPAGMPTLRFAATVVPDALLPDPELGWCSALWLEAERRRDRLFRTNKRGEKIVGFSKPQTK